MADTKEKGQAWWNSLSPSEQETYQRKTNVQWFSGLSVRQQSYQTSDSESTNRLVVVNSHDLNIMTPR